MSSTVNGYEGTGRALSLKLIQQLRQQQGASNAAAAQAAGHGVAGSNKEKGKRKVHEERWRVAAETAAAGATKVLTELLLDMPIRYGLNDPIEQWLNSLLCLDNTTHLSRIVTSTPPPSACNLYLVDRDALFSRHALSEALLQRIWSLYTSAHYKNSPNDLQMLSDAPGHRLMVLLGPNAMTSDKLPDILCVVQVAFEGRIAQKSVQAELGRGNKASGDMIPWTISQQFSDNEFAGLSGARVVRIATHPDVQKLGYGSRAIDLLIQWFQGELGPAGEPRAEGTIDGPVEKEGGGDAPGLDAERVAPRKKLPSLLTHLSEWPTTPLHWLGVGFGLTQQLLNFWTRKGFKVCYIRQTKNGLTGEHSTVVLKELTRQTRTKALYANSGPEPDAGWLGGYVHDYQRRLCSLLGFVLRDIDIPLAVTLIDPDRTLSSASSGGDGQDGDGGEASGTGNGARAQAARGVTAEELSTAHISQYDMKRLEQYSRNMVDHHMILDIVPSLARLVFHSRLPGLRLGAIQMSILLALGLQMKDVEVVSKDLDLPVNQVLAFFNKTMRKLCASLRSIVEAAAERELPMDRRSLADAERRAGSMQSLSASLNDDMEGDEAAFRRGDLTSSTSVSAPASSMKGKKGKSISVSDMDLQKALDSSMSSSGVFPSSISVPVGIDIGSPDGNDSGNGNDKERSGKKHKHKDSGSKRDRGSMGSRGGGGGGGSEKKKHKHSKH